MTLEERIAKLERRLAGVQFCGQCRDPYGSDRVYCPSCQRASQTAARACRSCVDGMVGELPCPICHGAGVV